MGARVDPTGPATAAVAVDTAPVTATVPARGRGYAPRAWLGRLVVFHFVCAAWVLFRSPDLATAGEIFRRLCTAGGPSPLVTNTVLAAIVIGLGTAAVPRIWWIRAQLAVAARPLSAQIIMVVAFLLVIYTFVGQQDVAPFIYFRF